MMPVAYGMNPWDVIHQEPTVPPSIQTIAQVDLESYWKEAIEEKDEQRLLRCCQLNEMTPSIETEIFMGCVHKQLFVVAEQLIKKGNLEENYIRASGFIAARARKEEFARLAIKDCVLSKENMVALFKVAVEKEMGGMCQDLLERVVEADDDQILESFGVKEKLFLEPILKKTAEENIWRLLQIDTVD